MDRDNFLGNVDWQLLGCVVLLVCIGLTAIYSASHGIGVMTNFNKQAIWFGIGLFTMLILYFLPHTLFQSWAYIVYGCSIVLLIAVLIFARKIAGNAGWLQFGGVSLQPAEMTKFATIIALAKFLSSRTTDIRTMKDFSIAIAMVLLPCSLILLQPDVGTALTYLTFIIPMIVFAGFDFYYILLIAIPLVFALIGFINLYALIVIGGAVIVILLFVRRNFILTMISLLLATGIGVGTNLYAAKVLKPHHLKRISTFLDPMSDPQGAGYNALQAKIAIGSGGLFGKGFLEGTQTQLKFIPAQWTDFIFCVIGEEFGFFGCAILIMTFMFLILRLVRLTSMIKSRFTTLVITGIVSLFMGHIVVNIGMTIGLVPVIGIPLPFLSYGGSSLFANLSAMAIVMNFYRNRRDLSFSG